MTPTPADIELPALPDSIVSTAPDRIWLDIGDAKDFIEPDDTFTTLMRGETTWSEDNATGCGIEYVRADRARTAASCAVPVPHATIAGALFDFLGFLTSHERRWTFSSRDDAGPAVEALQEWAGKRSLSLDEADVGNWLAPATVRPERTDAATVADTLESYNSWRRGNADGLEQPHPTLIGEAIDRAVAMLRADVPEGCTPADARVLREANHALAVEVQQLRRALSAVLSFIDGVKDAPEPFDLVREAMRHVQLSSCASATQQGDES